MNKLINTTQLMFLIIFMVMFLSSCSKDEIKDPLVDKAVPKVDDLVANNDFDFKINREIQLIVTNADTSKGVLSIYKSRDVSISTNQIFADPMSRITSVISTAQTYVNLWVNDNWSEIIIVWVPESANGLEIVKVVKLNPQLDIYVISL